MFFKYRRFILAFSWPFLFGDCFAQALSDNKASIRDFDISTIEQLGREIYKQDYEAAIATDVLFAQKLKT